MKSIKRRLRRWFGRPEHVKYDVPPFRFEEDLHPGWTFEDKWHRGTTPSERPERSS